MKKIRKNLLLILCFFAVVQAKATIPTYTLSEAIQKKLITVEIKGAAQTQPNSSSHYGKCIQMDIANLTTQHFKLQLSIGQQLIPGDSSIQNMMVTEGQLFVFTPKKRRKEYINAMCVQQHDGGPNANIHFTMGDVSKGHLLGIAQLIEKHKYFNNTAQYAVWCISDGEDISAIQNDDDTVMTYVLQSFVSEATGQPMPVKHTAEKPMKRYSKTTVTFEWKTPEPYTTTLVVLDKNNKPIKEILKDVLLPAGQHSYEIILSEADLPKGNYKVVLYLNNKPKMTRIVKLGR